KKLKGNKGLSNSEVCLAAALWSAKEIGATIDHVSLSEYFTESKKSLDIEALKTKLKEADGLLISTPVYFGDRGSLSQSLFNLIRNDKELQASLQDKIYAGLAVGAKRNGGQETTLIYQLMDGINCGLLGVGNDSETTSQYGGTGLAGDVGTMQKDEYGLKTAMGTGRRIARVANLMKCAEKKSLTGKHKITFWLLQDKNDVAKNYIKELIKDSKIDNIDATIIEISDKNIFRCLACDICPTSVDLDEVYRCIIKAKTDDLELMHKALIDTDAVIPVAYSPTNRDGIQSSYQRFMERTRYLRRGDYILSDLMTAPPIIEELGSDENLNIRMVTSMIRHHTILAQPMVAYSNNGKIVNRENVIERFQRFNRLVRTAISGKLQVYSEGINHLKYNPVGYVLSAVKDAEDEKLNKRQKMVEDRIETTKAIAKSRLK
ncbi:MAG: NAD(P)H-dependent oxidoreductase, partial [Flavobacteriales bacterium]|nr:NAD(P)H-dependent oxidoreductase [Flavobacteriales bacterium]